MRLLARCALLLALPLASMACVESSVHEQTLQKLEETRHALTQRETEIRAFQWQASTLGQQLHDAQQRSDALQRELNTQVQQLSATNAGLAERLKKLEGERASLILASSAEAAASSRDGKASVRPEDLRRMLAAADARNTLIVEELGRIERLLAGAASPSSRPHPGEATPEKPQRPGHDIIDPWGFGSRK